MLVFFLGMEKYIYKKREDSLRKYGNINGKYVVVLKKDKIVKMFSMYFFRQSLKTSFLLR